MYKSPLTTTRVVTFNEYYSAGYRLILDIRYYPANANPDIRPSPDIRTWLMENWTIQLFGNLLSSWISCIQPFQEPDIWYPASTEYLMSFLKICVWYNIDYNKTNSLLMFNTDAYCHFFSLAASIIIISYKHIYLFIGKRLD